MVRWIGVAFIVGGIVTLKLARGGAGIPDADALI